MALKLFENLFKKDQAKKNEEENLKSEIEDIQLDSEQNDGSFEDETDLNTSMEKTIFEEIKNADEVIDCEDTSEVKEEIEVQEIKETETFVPEWNGNKKLPVADQISIGYKALTCATTCNGTSSHNTASIWR